jgi:hypothetical protein
MRKIPTMNITEAAIEPKTAVLLKIIAYLFVYV